MSQVEGRQERSLGNSQNAVYTYMILPKIYYFLKKINRFMYHKTWDSIMISRLFI